MIAPPIGHPSVTLPASYHPGWHVALAAHRARRMVAAGLCSAADVGEILVGAAAPPRSDRDPVRVTEACALWAAAGIPGAHDVRLWCLARGFGEDGAALLEQYGMIRGTPAGSYPWPAWARFRDGRGDDWHAAGWRVLTPIYDAGGALVDVRARWAGVEPDAAGGWRTTTPPYAGKTLTGRGSRLAGTVLAPCPVARALLEDGPGARPGALRPWATWDGDVWLLEGDADVWAAAVALLRDGSPADGWPALLGYSYGTWTPELAARLPACARVTIWPDPDEAGQRMGAAILATIRGDAQMMGGQHGSR